MGFRIGFVRGIFALCFLATTVLAISTQSAVAQKQTAPVQVECPDDACIEVHEDRDPPAESDSFTPNSEPAPPRGGGGTTPVDGPTSSEPAESGPSTPAKCAQAFKKLESAKKAVEDQISEIIGQRSKILASDPALAAGKALTQKLAMRGMPTTISIEVGSDPQTGQYRVEVVVTSDGDSEVYEANKVEKELGKSQAEIERLEALASDCLSANR